MPNLLVKKTSDNGQVHKITPESAGWKYVGFDLYHLSSGESASGTSANREVILVVVEGLIHLQADGEDFGQIGERLSVFEKTKPHAVYLQRGANWQITGDTDCIVAICSAPSEGEHSTQRIDPESISLENRGIGSNQRQIHAIAMESSDIADRLLVTEVYTPSGNWSSYPPHRHDAEDVNEGDTTYLEETYYHRLNPSQGFVFQRVFTEDKTLDETMAAEDGDVVLVPRGHHPVGVPYGYESYYLNVMAGPERKWRFKNHPDHDWIAQRDKLEYGS